MKRIAALVFLCLAAVHSFAELNCAESNFQLGNGKITIEGAAGRPEKCIEVYYHIPEGVSAGSTVLIVVPGAGRNGWSYRDAWIEASEKFNVIVLSPSFSEDHYPRFWSYNLAGMIADVEISSKPRRMTGYTISSDPNDWIFGDLDRVFSIAKDHFALTATSYDAFGHSAGGQLLHRMAMFHSEHKASRILSSNSGWYTVPVFDQRFPTGLEGSVATTDSLRAAFEFPLVVFLGELDDKNETRGDLASSPEIDVQGPGRLERGRYFLLEANKTANAIGADMTWSEVIVPGVGHDYRLMSKAAAEYLYSRQ